MANIETVWTKETEQGVVAKVNKKVLEARGGKPERVSFSVGISRKRQDDNGTMPLFLRRGENADRMVIGLERAVADALREAEKLFLDALPPRPPRKKPLRKGHRPQKDAYAKVGTHGRKKAPAPRD